MEIKYELKGKVRDPELFDSVAEKIAQQLVKKEIRKNRDGKSWEEIHGVSRHQFRRLFDELKRLKRKLENQKKWDEIFPLVKMIKSKTAYAVSRMKDNKEQYTHLNDFMKTGIDKIKNQDDFETFCLLVEAVYGFYYELGGAKTER